MNDLVLFQWVLLFQREILIWTLHVEANQQQYRWKGTAYSSPYTNILIPAAWNQCNAIWCHCNWSHTIFMAIQRSCIKHLFNNQISTYKKSFFNFNQIFYRSKWFSMYPMYAHCYRPIHRINIGHLATMLFESKEILKLVIRKYSLIAHISFSLTTRCETTTWIGWSIIGNLLIGTNVKHARCLIFGGRCECVATRVILEKALKTQGNSYSFSSPSIQT